MWLSIQDIGRGKLSNSTVPAPGTQTLFQQKYQVMALISAIVPMTMTLSPSSNTWVGWGRG